MSAYNHKLLVLGSLFLLWPFGLQAASCDQDSRLNFVVRDPSRSFIGGAKVEVYKQEADADGQPKPGAKVASATTDTNLGRASLKWRNSAADTAKYAVRIQTITKDNASFWYYDYQIACGQELSQEETLSGLHFVLQESDGDPLANASFSVYSQLREAGGASGNLKNELLATLNSGSSGSVKAYLPQGSVRSLGRNQTDYYVFEITRAGVRYNMYNLGVSDARVNTVNFYLSRFRLQLKDHLNRPAVGTKVEVYLQELDSANQNKRGALAGSLTIGTDGYGYLELMPGTYVLGIKDASGQYNYFWDTIVGNSRSSERSLKLPASFAGTGACPTASDLNITLQTGSKAPAARLKFEVYEQDYDNSGLPAAGKKIGGGTTDANGRAKLNFKPSSEKPYMLKVWEKQESAGAYWFYDAAKFVCGYNRQVTKTVPSLKITWRDSAGQLKRNFKFSIWEQQFDADNQPILGAQSLGDYTTSAAGQAQVFVPSYNSYRPGQTGIYALVAKDASGNTITFYDLRPAESQDTSFSAQLSGLSGQLKDARGRALGNREIKLYQADDKQLGTMLLKTKTDANGRFRFEYPAGTYALSVLDDFRQESIFWELALQPQAPSRDLSLNLTSFSLAAGSSEALPAESTVRLYSLVDNGGSYSRGAEVASLKVSGSATTEKILADGPYLVTYLAADKQEYGTAFYASAGKAQRINLTVSSKYLLKDGQTFRLSVPAVSGSAPSSSAASGVKGRILLQVEDKGQAWYVYPGDNKRYFLGRPDDAFAVMRRLGLGISNRDFSALQANPSAWRQQAGKILIKTEDKGKAYYFDPVKLELHYLGRPQDAFNVMRRLGLGISEANLAKISSSR